MRARPFILSTRWKCFLVSFGLVAMVAPESGAALKKYELVRQILLHYANTSPQADFNSGPTPGSVTLIDDSGANPTLRKFVLTFVAAGTVNVPALTNGFIHFRQISTEGFEPETGTGSTNTSITWGNLAGWTISGQTFCHAMPSFICDLASAQDSETTDPVFLSSNYDMGTWTFHGTGWTMNLGFVSRTANSATGFGNNQYIVRGARVLDGTVPALPLIGIGGVGLIVLAMGVASMRGRGDPARRD